MCSSLWRQMGKRNKVLEYGTNNRAGMREAEGGRVEIVSITPNERAEKEREREGGGEREKEGGGERRREGENAIRSLFNRNRRCAFVGAASEFHHQYECIVPPLSPSIAAQQFSPSGNPNGDSQRCGLLLA